MRRFARRTLLPAALAIVAGASAGCAPNYSPNTYGANAVQQANKADQGVIVGVRRVDVAAGGTVGAATGAAAGGLIGAQTPGGSFSTAFGTVGGALVGGLVGTAAEHASADTFGYEYIVRKVNNELVSVTQKDAAPLAVGAKVLVIAGNQARIVPDYTVPFGDPAKPGEAKVGDAKPGEARVGEATPGDAKPGQAPESGAGGTSGTAPRPASVAATPLPPPPGAGTSPSADAGSLPAGSMPPPVVLTPVAPPAPIAASSP